MQHVFSVAFDFDDDAIRKKMEDGLYRQVKDEALMWAKDGIAEALPQKGYYGNVGKVDWGQFVADEFRGFLSENRQQIIDLAALTLAKRGNSSRKWKEVLADARAELEAESR